MRFLHSPARSRAFLLGAIAALIGRGPALDAQSAAPAAAARDSAAPPAIPFASRDLSLPTLQRLLSGITTTARVLVVGTDPDDVNPALIAWLTRGHHVEIAFLALTRGEAGQNFGGSEGGSTLGAIRVAEALAARRIDGGRQYFTREIDPGPATSAAQVFNAWPRDSILSDVVTVIRSFRPQVIIAMVPDSIPKGDGRHAALDSVVSDAFTAAGDPQRFPFRHFGAPWPVAKLYRLGAGIRFETASLDTAAGVTYAQIGMDARAQSRSQGLVGLTKPRSSIVMLRRVASRVPQARGDTSLFDGVDTTFARLIADDTTFVTRSLRIAAANVDSARHALATVSRRAAAPPLARVVRALTAARDVTTRCKHPAADAALVIRRASECTPTELDLDASIDVARERAVDALLSAAGVMLEASADRELVASSDSALVSVTLANHGSEPVTLADITLNGRRSASSVPVVVYPDSVGTIARRVTKLDEPRPWWITQHPSGGYAELSAFVDGMDRVDSITPAIATLLTPAVAVPENIVRTSDATVTLSVEGTTFRTSIGPIVYHFADAELGLQDRPIGGVPDVTFRFGRNLQWLAADKSFARPLHVRVESHADSAIDIGFGKLIPEGVRLDSMVKELVLAPHEARDLVVPIRGKLSSEERQQLAVWGARADGTAYQDGFQVVQRSYLPPIRIFRNSGAWLQPVHVTIPAGLIVTYVPDQSDDIRSALTEIGVQARELSPDELFGLDLSLVSTVVLGPHAFETHPDLAAQVGRLLNFVKRGGTLVVQRGDSATLASGLFPYPIKLGKEPQRVGDPASPVRPLAASSRLLSWPNRVSANDWKNWVVDRAELVPTEVDPRYTRIISTNDVDAPATENTILTARIGKGMLAYTTLTLDQQIAGAVPGAMRLLINMLSAGLSSGSP